MTNKYSAVALLLLVSLTAQVAQAQEARRIATKVLDEDR